MSSLRVEQVQINTVVGDIFAKMSCQDSGDGPPKVSEPTDTPKKSVSRGKRTEKRNNLAHRPVMNSAYQAGDFKEKLGEAFRSHVAFEDEPTSSVLHKDPFSCCVLPRFLQDEHFLEGLKDELLDQIFYEKNNDLYKFQQSDDLKKISTPHVRALRKFFQEEVLGWLKEMLKIPFSDKVDMTCSRYDYTDLLLCHDDELEGRRIAFILYLVPPWKTQDGGALDLFDRDEHGQPKSIVKSVMPQWNTMAFFEVSPASFHQVAEVLTEDKTRLSVNGWFHGPPITRPTAYLETPSPLKHHIPVEENFVYDWINPIYLDIEVQSQIQEKFENDSEIELQGFLKDEKYQEVVKALRGGEIHWQHRGPPNKRNYHKAQEEDQPEIIQQCLEFFQSEAMFLILSNLTGLKLHELAPNNDSSDEEEEEDVEESESGDEKESMSSREKTEKESVDASSGSDTELKTEKGRRRKRRKLDTGSSDSEIVEDKDKEKKEKPAGDPRCRSELRRWKHGSYTLLHDTDTEGADFALDAMLFCSCKGWQQEFGGYSSYIAKGEDEELLTVSPSENSLALVYRDKATLRFVKQVNHRILGMQCSDEFYDFSTVYYE